MGAATNRRWERLVCGVAAGLAGTAVLAMADRIEERARGRPAVYAPSRIAAGLADRFGRRLPAGGARIAGQLMRWPYGGAWGALLAGLAPPLPWPLNGLLLGTALAGFELGALPLSGLTPRLTRWNGEELITNVANCWLYGLATTAVHRRLRAGDGSRADPLPPPRPAAGTGTAPGRSNAAG
ncbi:MAG TPA: hypothetical protein VFD49_24180 [Candidatus Dormibacteraeota bacterium]|nr:hypothetical protein [Candidatus Dormibacteraeota bacterium]